MPATELAQVYSVVREWCAQALGKVPCRVAIEFDDESLLKLAIPVPIVEVPTDRAIHSPDFRSVNWFGHQFSFTPAQAACIQILWRGWREGIPEIGQQTLLEAIESTQNRLESVFKDHAAWGRMIVVGETRGTYRLQRISAEN